MPYDLEAFCADCHDALIEDGGNGGREQVRRNLEKLLSNQDFVAQHCGPNAVPGRHTIYHDDELDFHVLVHVYEKGHVSSPHDHGPSWAIYGQAVGETTMTVWQRADNSGAGGKVALEVSDKFRLEPGMAGVFHPGDIHSIDFIDGSRFVRVTGTDLTVVQQNRFNLEDGTVEISGPAMQGT